MIHSEGSSRLGRGYRLLNILLSSMLALKIHTPFAGPTLDLASGGQGMEGEPRYRPVEGWWTNTESLTPRG